MYINRFFATLLTLILAGCAVPPRGDVNRDMYGQMGDTEPTTLPDVAHMSSTIKPRKMAVLLPLTGDNAPAGRAVQTAISAAVLQNAPTAMSVSFHDTATDINTAIDAASGADIFVGPVFANDARILRDATDIPALSFTSDASAIGDDVMSVSLLPTASVDAIVSQMATDNVKNFVILAPENAAGKLMAGAAETDADLHDMEISGIFFYNAGDTESIKNTVADASMNAARVAANNRAREVLTDIMTNERLTAIERSNLDRQLERISKSETLGGLPYRAVLILGDGADAKTIASFLRYYGVSARDATIYGTALWDGSDDALYDFTLSGARFAALPEISPTFITTYGKLSDDAPSRLAAFGYDAANMAIGMLYSGGANTNYLTNPAGFMGANGLVRINPDGTNQRALRILELNGTATPRVVSTAASDFSGISNNSDRRTSHASAKSLETPGVNPMDFINIPERFHGKYKSKTYGANMRHPDTAPAAEITETVLPEDDSEPIVNPEYKSVKSESVSRTFIDSVEITE